MGVWPDFPQCGPDSLFVLYSEFTVKFFIALYSVIFAEDIILLIGIDIRKCFPGNRADSVMKMTDLHKQT